MKKLKIVFWETLDELNIPVENGVKVYKDDKLLTIDFQTSDESIWKVLLQGEQISFVYDGEKPSKEGYTVCPEGYGSSVYLNGEPLIKSSGTTMVTEPEFWQLGGKYEVEFSHEEKKVISKFYDDDFDYY